MEYDKDGKLIKETVSKGDDYAIYENINGKMRIIEAKEGETISLRHFNEDGSISHLKPEIPVKTLPSLVYKGELPKNLTKEEIPDIKEILENWPKDANEYRGFTKVKYSDDIEKLEYDTSGNIVSRICYHIKEQNLEQITKGFYSTEGKYTQFSWYDKNGTLSELASYRYNNSGEKYLRNTLIILEILNHS